MKPESAAFLRKALEFLKKAGGMLDDWPDDAGRAAYLAGLHGAQALIVERTGKLINRHRGVQRELARLTKDEPGLDMELRAFLGRAYNLEAIADYETGEARVTTEQALKRSRRPPGLSKPSQVCCRQIAPPRTRQTGRHHG
jgi:uncharacterized protein (UPF0332 family)